MAFQPRTFEQIRDDMWNYVTAQTTLTDFEIGSVIRTIIEAAALEDDEQYFQMVQLMDAFSIATASGSDLDRRVADFNVQRLGPAGAAGQVVFQDNLLPKTKLTFAVAAGSGTLLVGDSSVFPSVGFPYKVRIGEGTIAVEDVSVTANSIISNTLTLAGPTVNPHSIGDRVAFVSGVADKTISASQQVQVPAFANAAPIKYVTTESATIVNGNYESTPANAKAVVPGSLSNCGANQISQFSASPPFNGCGVRNPKSFAGGRDAETDQQLRDRARGQIQSLSRGTVTAVKQATLGVTDPVTGQRVVTANVLEDFIENEVIVYIDDGTGFTPDTVALADSALAGPIAGPTTSIAVTDASQFPAAGYILIGADTVNAELAQYNAVNYGTNTITITAPTVNTHAGAAEVVLVDTLELNAQPGTQFLQSQNFPIVRDSQRLWISTGGGWVLQTAPVDYFFNMGTGQIELATPLGTGAQVVTHYTYYTGLIKTVQTVIDGNPNDPVNFPGVRAAGVDVVVQQPVIHRVSVRVSITAQPGGPTETALAPQCAQAIESYISSLGIGDDVIKASIIDAVMNVAGVYNCVVVTPSSDIVILQNELPVPYDTNGNSLVTVT